MHTHESLPIFVINLERSPDRRHFMQKQFDSLGLRADFFAAVDASRGDLEGISRYDEDRALWTMGHPLAPGEVGCFASHYRLWERCVAMQTPIVVMEDDVRIDAGFQAALEHTRGLIHRYGFVRLSALFERRYQIVTQLDSRHQLIRYLKGPYGTQCYALAPTGAQILIDHAKVWINAVDSYIDAFWTHGLASLAITPFHVASDEHGADASTIGLGRFRTPRPWYRELRRNITHFHGRVQRMIFNLRYGSRSRLERYIDLSLTKQNCQPGRPAE